MMPVRLYKYHAYTAQALESLILREVWLADPTHFNDPYDVTLRIEAPPPFDEFKRFVEARDSTTYSDLTAREMYTAATLLHEALHESLKGTGIYSVSDLCDNFLMWAHYADGHRGFCIEYDTSGLKPDHFETVRYVDTHSGQLPFGATFQDWDSIKEALDEISLTKPRALAYEQEWRMVRVECHKHGRREEIPGVSSLIFGCSTPSAHIRALMTLAHNQFGVDEFTRMEKAEDAFSLVRRPCVWQATSVRQERGGRTRA